MGGHDPRGRGTEGENSASVGTVFKYPQRLHMMDGQTPGPVLGPGTSHLTSLNLIALIYKMGRSY